MKPEKSYRSFALRAIPITLLISFLFSLAVQAKVYLKTEITRLADDILSLKLARENAVSVQKWLDGDKDISEWYLVALSGEAAGYDFSVYADKLEQFLDGQTVRSATTCQKYALALIAAGRRQSKYVKGIIDETVGRQGIMSYVFGLHLLSNGCQTDLHTEETIISKILSLALDDGGWALTGEYSDTDVTAMAVQALAPYCGKYDDVCSAVENAVGLLSEKQLDSGDYSSYGSENAESAAQVIVALSALGIDIQSDSRFIKNGNTVFDGLLKYQLDGGGYSHLPGGDYSSSATVQAYFSFIAYLRCIEGQGSIYRLQASAESEDEQAANVDSANAAETKQVNRNQSEGKSEQDAIGAAEEEHDIPTYKTWAVLAAVLAAVIICAVFWFSGRRSVKNFIFIIAALAAVSAAILFTDIKSTGSYYSGEPLPKEKATGSVTMVIQCNLIAGIDDRNHIPANGIILAATEFDISEGETVYNILVEAARTYGIQMEQSGAGYIAGINYVYELDYGDLSGWIYKVNGEIPSLGSAEYKLQDGDRIEWLYSLELGADLN